MKYTFFQNKTEYYFLMYLPPLPPHLPPPLKKLKLMAHGVAFSFISLSACDRVSQSKTQPSSVSL